MNSIARLLDIASEALVSEPARDIARFGSDYEDLLSKNGFVAFESALHVFSTAEVQGLPSVCEWNEPSLWKKEYGGSAPNGHCFAQDLFGNQFFLASNRVYLFNVESAEIELVAPGLDEWASVILDDYRAWTGWPLAHDWQARNGQLPLSKRLIPTSPFILGGAVSADNLAAVDALEAIRFQAYLWQQTKDLKPGTKIRFKVD